MLTSIPGLLRLTLAAALLQAFAGQAAAATPAVQLVEGQNFLTLVAPEPVATGDKIEVLEVFSYGCVHCFEHEPALRAFRSRLPADVALIYMPATFNENFALYARGYYAAEALGKADKTHAAVFETVWTAGKPARDLNSLADLYAGLGVDREQFLTAARSMGVQAQLRSAGQKAERLRLEGTPTFYVDGKYQLLSNGAKSHEDIVARLDALIARARAERKSAAAARH
jgi:thiol:disulfide interchange protein DsbA